MTWLMGIALVLAGLVLGLVIALLITGEPFIECRKLNRRDSKKLRELLGYETPATRQQRYLTNNKK